MSDLRQSPKYARYLSFQGWMVDRLTPQPSTTTSDRQETLFVYSKRLPLVPFSVTKIQRFGRLPDFSSIEQIARSRRALSMTLEPGLIADTSASALSDLFKNHRYLPSRSPLLPTKTLVVDLSRGEDSLFLHMDTDARSSVRKARRRCQARVVFSTDQKNIRRFHVFWNKHGKGPVLSKQALGNLLRAFEEDCFLVLCFSKDERLLAGTIILLADECGYYAYAVTSGAGRASLAGYLVVWEAMRRAKISGCQSFDFEGVYDKQFNQLKRWKGFSNFKKKFGGSVVSFPGPFVRNFLPLSLGSIRNAS